MTTRALPALLLTAGLLIGCETAEEATTAPDTAAEEAETPAPAAAEVAPLRDRILTVFVLDPDRVAATTTEDVHLEYHGAEPIDGVEQLTKVVTQNKAANQKWTVDRSFDFGDGNGAAMVTMTVNHVDGETVTDKVLGYKAFFTPDFTEEGKLQRAELFANPGDLMLQSGMATGMDAPPVPDAASSPGEHIEGNPAAGANAKAFEAVAAAYADKDVDKVLSLFGDEHLSVSYARHNSQTLDQAAMRKELESSFEGAESLAVETISARESGDWVVGVVKLTVVNKKGKKGKKSPMAGKTVEQLTAFVMRFENGKAVEVHQFTNLTPIMLESGAIKMVDAGEATSASDKK
jgi:ketosteroid isomerase-like protein